MNTIKIPKPLIDDISEGKCLPFIGAGFSVNAELPPSIQMPDWDKLTEALADLAEVSSKLSGPEVASEFEKKYGRVQLIESIRQELLTDVIKPGPANIAFANLTFETIYTTNYDLLLELSYEYIKRPYRSIVGELQMPFHSGQKVPNIIKMHGDLRHEEHMIITKEDYDDFLDKYPAISTHLSAMLITKTALFIGYSLYDPDFNHIRNVIKSRLKNFERMSYIIQFNKSKQDVDKLLKDNLHVINLKTKTNQSKCEVLTDFFNNLLNSVDINAGKQFREKKPEIFEPGTLQKFESTSLEPDSSTLLSSTSNYCFVMMPFSKHFNTVYSNLIKPVIHDTGLEVIRADDIYSQGIIIEQIRSAIKQAKICIVDITGSNPNVIYEFGIAQTLGKPTVIITNETIDIPFDIKHLRMIVYSIDFKVELENSKELLRRAIQNVLVIDSLDEAKRHIQNRMYRASVAVLGILLEQSLKNLISEKNLLVGNFEKRDRHFITMSKMIMLLKRSKIITSEEYNVLRNCIKIRNEAVHKLVEPTKYIAVSMLETVEQFIKKYL